MAEKSVLLMKDRLKSIVDLSYLILCNKIASGDIQVPNESSLQMQFGVILKQVGQLFEFAANEHFVIELETPQVGEQFQKSGTTKARCDITLKIQKGKKEVCAAIEIKHFRHHKNAAITDNRYSVIEDLKNLEQYKSLNNDLLCYEVIYTDNKNYTKPNRSKINLTGQISGKYNYTKGRSVILDNIYNSKWDCYENEGHYFLKIEF